MTTADSPAQGGSPYLAIFRRRLPLILLPLIVGALLGAALGLSRPHRYDAAVDVLVRPGVTNPLSQTPTSQRQTDVSTATEVQIAKSGRVADVVAQDLQGKVSRDELLSNVRVVAPDGTEVLTFHYTASSADAARQRALAFATGYLQYRGDRLREDQSASRKALEDRATQLRAQLATVNSTVSRAARGSTALAAAQAQQTALSGQLGQIALQQADLDSLVVNPGQVISSDVPPVTEAGIRWPLLAASGAVLGLLVGLLLALLRETTDDRVRVAPGESAVLDHPVLARVRNDPGSALVPGRRPVIASEYATLAARLTALAARHGQRVVLVTSATSAQRTTAVVGQLAAALAADGSRVAVLSLRAGHELPALLGTEPVRRGQAARGDEAGLEGVEGRGVEASQLDASQFDASQLDASQLETSQLEAMLAGQQAVPAEAYASRRAEPSGSVPISSSLSGADDLGGTAGVQQPRVVPSLALPSLDVVTGLEDPTSEELVRTTAGLRRDHDWVVLDGLPLLEGGAALRATTVSDGVLLVAPAQGLRQRDLAAVDDALRWSEVPVLGIVLAQKGAVRPVRTT